MQRGLASQWQMGSRIWFNSQFNNLRRSSFNLCTSVSLAKNAFLEQLQGPWWGAAGAGDCVLRKAGWWGEEGATLLSCCEQKKRGDATLALNPVLGWEPTHSHVLAG